MKLEEKGSTNQMQRKVVSICRRSKLYDDCGWVPKNRLQFVPPSAWQDVVDDSDGRLEHNDYAVRAVNGHNRKVNLADVHDIDHTSEVLYHKTTLEACESIMTTGLSKMRRQYVHSFVDPASTDRLNRGSGAVILSIDVASLRQLGFVVEQTASRPDMRFISHPGGISIPPKVLAEYKNDAQSVGQTETQDDVSPSKRRHTVDEPDDENPPKRRRTVDETQHDENLSKRRRCFHETQEGKNPSKRRRTVDDTQHDESPPTTSNVQQLFQDYCFYLNYNYLHNFYYGHSMICYNPYYNYYYIHINPYYSYYYKYYLCKFIRINHSDSVRFWNVLSSSQKKSTFNIFKSCI